MGRLSVLALAATLAVGCTRPYAGPKTLAALGTGLMLAGSAAWIAGAQGNRPGLIVPGLVITAAGTATVMGAGGWLAVAIDCEADPDCPEGEWCRELPAPQGGVPYKQCTQR
jgi:hypothetical protein